MNKCLRSHLLAYVCCLTPAGYASDVVINEIMYRAPNDLTQLEYVELWNTSDQPVDIRGWKIEGVGLEITTGLTLAPGAFHVTCRDAELFERIYQQKPDSVYTKSLSDGGERLKLVRADGSVVESVKYNDKTPWPTSADGRSASLERITPTHEADDPVNWAPSPLTGSFDTSPTGTPGKMNSVFQANLPPIIHHADVIPSVLPPGKEIQLSANIQGAVEKVEVWVSMIEPGKAASESVIEMSKDGNEIYRARIPEQAGDRIVRYRFKATGINGTTGWLPHPNDLRPTFSSYVKGELPKADITVMHFISTSDTVAANFDNYKSQRGRRFGPGGFGFGPPPRESSEDIKRRELAQRAANDSLKAAFANVTLGKEIPTEKLIALSKAVRTAHEALGALSGEIAMGGDMASLEKTVDSKLKQIAKDLTSSCRPLLSVKDNASLSESILASSSDTRGPRGFDPTRLIQAIFDIESSWYQHLITETPTPAQAEKLVPAFASALKQREEILKKLSQQGREPDLPTIFGEVRTASTALEAKAQSITGNAGSERAPETRTQQTRSERGEDPRGGRNRFGGGPGRGFGSSNNGSPVLPQGEAALVYREPSTDDVQFFDYINILPRKSGNKVRFQKDHPLNDMTTLNVLYEPGDATTINEMLAYPLYEQAGNVTVNSGAVRVLMNGAPVGYHLWFEQPNGSFFKRRGIDPDGNLYKVIWQQSNRPSEFTPESERTDRNDIAARWEKVTNPHESYSDLVEVVEDFEKASGNNEAMWEAIEKHFDVDQAINYYAVNLLISHWDGFFNNYFLYHDVKGTGKWSILPWDQDSTWSLRGGSPESLSKMPLNYGGEGARPPGSSDNGRDRGRFGGRGGFGGFGGFGGGGFGWWRDGDIISRSLIGNPTFFAKYKARLQELVQNTFTPENFHPIFNQLESDLLPEVALRAQLSESDAESEKQRFANLFNTLREHLELRRAFLQSELNLGAEQTADRNPSIAPEK